MIHEVRLGNSGQHWQQRPVRPPKVWIDGGCRGRWCGLEIQAGGRRATMSEPVIIPGRSAVAAVTIVVVVDAVRAQDHRLARESQI